MDSLERASVIKCALGGDGYCRTGVLGGDYAFVGHRAERREVRRRKGDEDLVRRHRPRYLCGAGQLKGGGAVAYQVERPALDLYEVVVTGVGACDLPVPLHERSARTHCDIAGVGDDTSGAPVVRGLDVPVLLDPHCAFVLELAGADQTEAAAVTGAFPPKRVINLQRAVGSVGEVALELKPCGQDGDYAVVGEYRPVLHLYRA